MIGGSVDGIFFKESEAKPGDWPVNDKEAKLEAVFKAVEKFRDEPSYKTREVMFAQINEHDLNQRSYRGISAKEFFTDGTAILIGDPMPDKSVEQMQLDIASISSTQELVDVYVQVHNKFWYIEDALYDYEEESEEYIRVKEIVEAWGEMMDLLDKKIMVAAKEEGLLAERQPNSGTVKQLESFMKKYGYKDGGGWWIKLE